MSRCLILVTRALLIWVGGLFLCVDAMHAAVDPDLFDGRMTPPPPAESPESSGSEGASGATEQSAGVGAEEASSESRDFSEIDGVTAGEAVDGESSKTGAPSELSSGSGRDLSNVGEIGGGESVHSASSKSGATTPSGGSAGGTPVDGAAGGGSGVGSGVPAEGMTGAGGSGGYGAPIERSFEEFGFGTTGAANRTVEVNQSKNASVPPLGSTSGSVPLNASAPNSGSGAGGSTPATETGSGDYGSDLPSGL